MRKLAFVISLSFLAGLSYAGCGATHIIINNATQTLCKLKDYHLKHGYLDYVSIVPAFLLPNSTTHATVLNPSFLGAELELRYICGNEEITLSTKGEYHFFVAGEITGTSTAKNLKVEFFTMRGNCLWTEHGSIQWLIQDGGNS